MKNYLSSEETLFRNRDAFEIDHIPEVFNFREAQLKELFYAIQPATYGGRPFNMVLRGISGTGKTTTVKRIFTEIEETTKNIVPVYINCQADRSKFSVFTKISQKLFGYQVPPKGIPINHVIHAIGKYLSEKNVVLLVCFDDANYLLPSKTLNDVLYILLRFHDEHPMARVGVILPMSNLDVNLVKSLDPCVISVLQPNEIFFPPYMEEELREILLERIKVGLYPGVITPIVYDVLIEQTMISGDIRVGLDLLKRSVMAAERAGRKQVTEEDIISSFDAANLVHMHLSVRALGDDERQLYGHMAHMYLESDNPMTTGTVFESSRQYMTMSKTKLSTAIRKFSDMRLIEFSSATGDGKAREIALRYDPEKVVEVCEG